MPPTTPADQDYEVGDNIVLPQVLNATCGTIESIDRGVATCVNAHDIFGPLKCRVRVPLNHAKPWGEAPRTLSLGDVVSL